MSSKNRSVSNQEEGSPLPPYTRCTAVKDFPGEQAGDLRFTYGEVLTIIEPCSVVFWYLAENSRGERGTIPITFVRVHKSKKKKPPPLPPPSSPLSESPLLQPPNNTSSTPPLPPKPPPSSHQSTKKQTFITYPRLAQNTPQAPLHENVVRTQTMGLAHTVSHTPLSTVRSPPVISPSPSTHSLPPQCHDSSPFNSSLQSSTTPPPLPLQSHRYSHSTTPLKPYKADPSPFHQAVPSVPPPLPSPRFRAKPVPPPLAPKSFSSKSSSHTVASSSPQPSVQSQLPPNPSSVIDIDKRPPALLPFEATSKVSKSPLLDLNTSTLKYRDQKEFVQKSGWFSPNLETALCRMMFSGQIIALTSMTTGIYIFLHKHQKTKKYVGKSRAIYHDLVQMFHRLYQKKENKLNPLEKEIKFNSPDADQWYFRMYSVGSPDLLEVEANKRILEYNTLHPSGLNTEVRFTSKESFHLFAESYANRVREKASKHVNPISKNY